jgi:hypothetical protein
MTPPNGALNISKVRELGVHLSHRGKPRIDGTIGTSNVTMKRKSMMETDPKDETSVETQEGIPKIQETKAAR